MIINLVVVHCHHMQQFSSCFYRKLRASVPGKLLLNLCFALIGLYSMFIMAYHSTTVIPLCAVAGGLLHYFMLVMFAVMAAEAINLYIKLVVVLGWHAVQRHYVLKATLVCWSKFYCY